jgi:5-methylcytosine-specific restriction endonuclease McrA
MARGGTRATTAQRGYGARWQRERAAFLAQPENQFCVKCQARGMLNPGTMRIDGSLETNPRRIGLVVNHITPHKGNQRLMWDRANWEPLCHDDHDIVAQRAEHGRETGAVDINGRPVGQHPWNKRS